MGIERYARVTPRPKLAEHGMAILNRRARAGNAPLGFERIETQLKDRIERVTIYDREHDNYATRRGALVEELRAKNPDHLYVAGGDGTLNEVMSAVLNPHNVRITDPRRFSVDARPLEGIRSVGLIPNGSVQSTNKVVNGKALTNFDRLGEYFDRGDHQIYRLGSSWLALPDGIHLANNSISTGVSARVFAEYGPMLKKLLRGETEESYFSAVSAILQGIAVAAAEPFGVEITLNGKTIGQFDDALEVMYFGLPIGLGHFSFPYIHPVAGPDYQTMVMVLCKGHTGVLGYAPTIFESYTRGLMMKAGMMTADPTQLPSSLQVLGAIGAFDPNALFRIRHNDVLGIKMSEARRLTLNGDMVSGSLDEFQIMAAPEDVSIPILGVTPSIIGRTETLLASTRGRRLEQKGEPHGR